MGSQGRSAVCGTDIFHGRTTTIPEASCSASALFRLVVIPRLEGASTGSVDQVDLRLDFVQEHFE